VPILFNNVNEKPTALSARKWTKNNRAENIWGLYLGYLTNKNFLELINKGTSQAITSCGSADREIVLVFENPMTMEMCI